MHPRISIVTPSLNQGNYLEATVKSVLGQLYPNLEYIVIDGGSTDNSVEILKKYNSILTYWISEKDGGQAEAINKGFDKATGDIYMWLNSDDMLMPNVLFNVANHFKAHGNRLYLGNCLHFRQGNEGVKSWGSDIVASHRKYCLKEVDYVIQPASFWSSTLWHITGPLNTKLHYAFDWEWFLRVLQNQFEIHCIEDCLSLFRYHETHKSGNGGNKRRDEIQSIYQKFYPERAMLYTMLRDEDNRQYSLKAKIIRKYLTSFKESVTKGMILKSIDRRYQSFSVEEINDVLAML